jgi:hypothetical protein
VEGPGPTAFGGMGINMSTAAATNYKFLIGARILIIASLQLLLFC